MSVPLYPLLGPSASLLAFKASNATLTLAISPRANTLAVFKSPIIPEKKSTGSEPDNLIYFAQWDHVNESDIQLYTEAYVTFDSLQRLSFMQQQEDGINVFSSKNVSACWRAIAVYLDHIQAHLDRLALSTPFNEPKYLHYMSVYATFSLFQTIYTSESGNVSTALTGEELLFWLNTNSVAPTTEDGQSLTASEKPWLDDNFWPYIIRCTLRGLPKSASHFLNQLTTSHPNRTLRRLVTEMIPVLEAHPRSSTYNAEHEYLAAYRRWKEQLLRSLRQHIDELDDDEGTGLVEGEGEWRDGVEIICGIMEGKRETLFAVCKEQEWGWQEALGVWGVWIDIRFTREDLATVVPLLIESLPVDSSKKDEVIQTALLTYDTQNAVEVAASWDLWLAVHTADMLDKLGEFGDESATNSPDQPSTRTQLLIAFASHLHSAPSLWELTLEYMAACGAEGRHLIAEVLKRVDIDIDIPNPPTPTGLTNGNGVSNGKSKRTTPKTPPRANQKSRAASEIEIDGHDDADVHAEAEASAWKKWEEKVVKIIAVCKDYGLEDVMASVCKSISQALTRRGIYGRAVQYCVMARDGRGIGRIADLLLQEYITKGAEEFRIQVANIPPQYLPSATSTLSDEHNHPFTLNRGDISTSRLHFISRYAEYHAMYARGEKRDAARFLVRMLTAGLVPRWWWGVVLIDAGGMLDEVDELLISTEEAYELLRHLEEIYIRAEQGSGDDYLGALEKIMARNGDASSEEMDRQRRTENALQQLEVVRLTLARYLARCCTAGIYT